MCSAAIQMVKEEFLSLNVQYLSSFRPEGLLANSLKSITQSTDI